MVKTALISCKKRKACDQDNLFYEKFIYGGGFLTECITKLFNHMFEFSHTPTDMKKA
jgi:hypothetical protein